MFTKSETTRIANKIQAAVREVCAEEGIDLESVRSTYGESLTVRLTLAKVERNESGVNVKSKSAQEWINSGWYEWKSTLASDAGAPSPEQMLGVVFTQRGVQYRFDGWNNRARRMPVILTDLASGKQVKATTLYATLAYTAFRDQQKGA